MGLRNAVSKLNDAVEDLSSLHVQTFSGEINITANQDGFDGIKALVARAKADGKIQLVAEAYYQFDGDSYNFLAKDASEVSSKALEMHKAAVEAGMETRRGLMELVSDIFK